MFHNRKDLARKLKRWEKEYNEDRSHLAHKGKTPAWPVRELAPPSEPVPNLLWLLHPFIFGHTL